MLFVDGGTQPSDVSLKIKNVTAFEFDTSKVWLRWASEPYWSARPNTYFRRYNEASWTLQYWDALLHPSNYLDQADYGDGDAPADPRKLIENSLALMYMKPPSNSKNTKFWHDSFGAANTYDMVIVELRAHPQSNNRFAVYPLENLLDYTINVNASNTDDTSNSSSWSVPYESVLVNNQWVRLYHMLTYLVLKPDVVPPTVIAAPVNRLGHSYVTVAYGQPYTDENVTAEDNMGQASIVETSGLPIDTSTPLVDQLIVYTAEDASGNRGYGRRNVVVGLGGDSELATTKYGPHTLHAVLL